MAENLEKILQQVQAPEAKPLTEMTEAQLSEQMTKAIAAKDYKQLGKVSAALVKYQKVHEEFERRKKENALEAITTEVKNAIARVLQPMVDKGKLDLADGIWFTQDFAEKLVTCRLIKSETKARTSGGGGGGGKKFDASTSSLLEKYGSQEFKDGQTFSQAYEANTDKNWRYAIRNALLKLDGVIS